MTRPFSLFVLLFTLLAAAGCTAYQTQSASGRSFAGVQRFFVIANANDSRGLEHRIVAALRSHGLTADAGPRTMMPDDTQAVLTYSDHWAWDFGDHLVHLQIDAADLQSPQPFATATFAAKIPGRKTPAEIVNQLVDQLLGKAKR